MSSIAYLPNVQPGNNNTAQMRRRTNGIVAQVSQQVGALETNTGDLGTLNTTKAPIDSPTFQNVIGVENATTHTSATAGTATALPATPAGYVTQMINGKSVKVPYYL